MRSSNTFPDILFSLVRREVLRGALLAVAALSAAPPLLAVDPNRTMSQYVRERWEAEAGLPRGPVYAIAQTTDGYLWIGTERGIIRFDGVNFRTMNPASGDLPRISHVLGLLTDRDGTLWVRLRRPSLLRFRDGKFEDAAAGFQDPIPTVTAMAHSVDGALLTWALRSEPIAAVVRGDRMETVATPQRFPRSPVLSFAQTANGDIWIGTRDSGLFRIRNGNTEAILSGLPDRKVNAMAAGSGNELWIGTDSGVVRWDGNKLTTAGVPEILSRVQALTMLVDRDGNLWVGTNSHGLYRVNAQGAELLPPASDEPIGHAPEAISALFEDREGSIWFGDGRGLEKLRDSTFISYSEPEGVRTGGGHPVYVDRGSRVWYSPITGGLSWFQQGRKGQVSLDGLERDIVYSIHGSADEIWLGRQKGGLTRLTMSGTALSARTFTQKDGLAQDTVYSVYTSRDGSVWAGTVSAGVSRLQEGRFTTYAIGDGLASNTVLSMLETTDGTMWFATPDGLNSFSHGNWRTYQVKDGLPSNEVNCLFEDGNRTLWAGTSAGLAVRKGNGGFRGTIGEPPYLKEPIFGIAVDAFGALWITGANHIFRVDREKLLEGKLGDGDLREYGLADGLRGIEGVKRHRSLVTDSQARLWFALNRGISVVDPARLRRNTAPAVVHMESILIDGQQVPLQPPIRVPGSAKRIALRYRGLSLPVPQRVRFRYQLNGLDTSWGDPVLAREAVYTNLAPGEYRFRVIAANSDGVWSPTEASISFEVDPLLWQTWWFRTAVLLALILATVAVYRFRLRQVTAQMKLRFEERLSERTRIAQELHDTLLQGFISASMQVHVVKDRLPPDSKEWSILNRATELMSQVIAEGRNTVRGLRSERSTGQDLEHAFSRVPQEFGYSSRDSVDFRVIAEGEPRSLHPILRDEIHRMGTEALINAFRHSSATKIELEMKYTDRRFGVAVRDNGCGIDPQVLRSGREGHFGLSGMRERAERIGAEFHVFSSSGGGTEIEFSLPAHIIYSDYRKNTLPILQYLKRRIKAWKQPIQD